MKVDGKSWRTIWPIDDGAVIEIIDQTLLPHEFKVVQLKTLEDAAVAISDMLVRGAPLIGATAAYGVVLAMAQGASDAEFDAAYDTLLATRPTAINLKWALDEARKVLMPLEVSMRHGAALKLERIFVTKMQTIVTVSASTVRRS